MPFFLANWKLIGIGIAIVAVFLSGWTVNGYRWQVKLETAVEAQKQADEKQCKDDQAITKGANDDLQTKYDAIARKLAAAKRVQPAKCVLPLTGKADIGSGGNGYAGQNGISTDWLRDYAAECETYRSQRTALGKFIDDVWAARGQ